MNLLMTVPCFWPYVRRGSERLVHDVAVEMAARGHEVEITTTTPVGPPWSERREGVSVDYRRLPALALRAGLSQREAFGLVAARAALRSRADVFTSSHFGDAAALGRIAGLRRRRFVMSLHGTPERRHWEREAPRLHALMLDGLARADMVTCLSAHAAQRLEEDYGVRGRVMMPGIFCAGFARRRPPVEHRTVVCAAAVDDVRKRIDLLVEAFALVAATDASVRLLLVGHGNPARLNAQLASLPPSLASRVTHRPAATGELPGLYTECAVGALCSEREAYGLVVLEYLAAGMPVVGTADGGIPELMGGPRTGASFPPGDVEACASALRHALALSNDPATVDACRSHARRWDWSRAGDAFEAMYRELAP